MEELTKALEPLLVQLTALVEMVIELAGGLLDNPIGLLILIVVVPTILGFCWNIIGAVLDVILGLFGVISKILLLPLDLVKFVVGLKHVHKQRKTVDENLDEPVLSNKSMKKKVKQTTPDQDLADSLKTNLLDE